jgi:hypothetical protein
MSIYDEKHQDASLLLQRLYALVPAIEKSTGTVFIPQGGHILVNVERGPEREVLTYAMGLRVIEWAIRATSEYQGRLG